MKEKEKKEERKKRKAKIKRIRGVKVPILNQPRPPRPVLVQVGNYPGHLQS